ncbi:MAG: M20 family metallopeptidase [Desulfobulbaceae bacterium]|nr:M20 family metallopeptidase [Desulfobulbaceae bacterium]
MNIVKTPDSDLIFWMRGIRRHLHQYPELAFQEYETAFFIGKKLTGLGIYYKENIGKTGIVATIGKQDPNSPCVALRADMDALPLEEQTGLSFSSRTPGIMHGCGHDGHVAMLLGAAAMLQKTSLPGRVVLLFQPAEEGKGGAREMIADGGLEGVEAIFAGHIDRHFKVNEIGVESGLICAYADEFSIQIQSKGGHAAKPHETADCIVVAGLLVMSLQTLVSREVNPSFPSVVTVGKINGGTAPNAIAAQALLQGTIRTTHPNIRETIITGLSRMVKAMENLYQVETTFALTEGYPPVINNPVAAQIAKKAAMDTVGAENVKGLPQPSLGGEDFSFYLKKVPGCLVRFGARKEGLGDVPAHSPHFDFDEDVLPVGAQFLANTALLALERIKELREA